MPGLNYAPPVAPSVGCQLVRKANPAQRRRRRHPDEVRRELLNAGRTLFAERGYEATTQRGIAHAAGVSTSVLFRHFSSKSRLLIEAVIEPFDEFVDSVGSVLEASGAAGWLHGPDFVADLYTRLLPHRESLRALLTTLQSADGDALMRELGVRLDPLFAEVRTLAEADRTNPCAGSDQTELSFRLMVGTVTTLVVLDDWFLPPADASGQAALFKVLGSMASQGNHAELAAAFDTVHAVPLEVESASPGLDPGAAMNSRGSRRPTDEVRQALLVSAAKSFATKGFAATTYADIAEAAQTSESALFRHFGSKSNLLMEAALAPFVDAFASVSRRWAAVAVDERRSRQPEFVADLYLTVVSHRELLRILMGVANDPAHQDVNQAVTGWFATTFGELLEQQQAQTSSDHAYEPDLRMRAAITAIAAAAALDDWFLPHGEAAVTPESIIHAISQSITRGRRP